MLDHLVNPYWPYLPHMTRELVEASDRIERARSNVPEDPLNYDFLYHVLEADENGRQPFRNENTLNNMFHLKSVSCLRLIAESQDKVYFAYLPRFAKTGVKGKGEGQG